MKYNSEAETRKHIGNVTTYLSIVIRKLLDRANNHDNSKLREPEKSVFDEYAPKLRDVTYGSDKYKEYLKEMQVALKHHYKENKHHPEHYLDGTGIGFTSGLHDMSLIDIIEMLCDWKAATLRHKDGDIKKSIEQNQERFGYSDELKNIFLNTLEDLREF